MLHMSMSVTQYDIFNSLEVPSSIEICCVGTYFFVYSKACLLSSKTSIISVQKPLGLLSLLDEESTFPNGTDLTLANKLKQHLNDNSCFRGDRGKVFTISHYAGEVIALENSVVSFYRTCQIITHDMLLGLWVHF